MNPARCSVCRRRVHDHSNREGPMCDPHWGLVPEALKVEVMKLFDQAKRRSAPSETYKRALDVATVAVRSLVQINRKQKPMLTAEAYLSGAKVPQ